MLEVGVNTIPLYGKLTHMLQCQSNGANACRVWGDTVQKVADFQQDLRIDRYYLVYKYGVNAKTYGKDLPHTTIASLSIQAYNKL